MTLYNVPMGIITIAFDDGYKATCENTARFLHDKGIHATYAIPAGFVGDTLEGRAVLDNDHLFTLKMMGHEVASHTVRHKNLLDVSLKEGPEAVDKEMIAAKKQLESVTGMDIRSFVFPFIEANNTPYLRQLASEHYTSSRLTTEKFAYNNLPVRDPYSITGVAITTDFSLDDCAKLANIAIANDLWLIEVFHLVAPENTKSFHRDAPYRFYMHPDDFRKHVEHLVSKGAAFMTQGEAIEKLAALKAA